MSLHTLAQTNEPQLLIPRSTDQMQVEFQLTGIEWWIEFLEELYEGEQIDEITKNEWLEQYDGYEMTWTFSYPTIPSVDGNIDGACIYGKEYVDGGFCCGLTWQRQQTGMTALWFSQKDLEAWTQAVGFSNAVDDTAHWRFK